MRVISGVLVLFWHVVGIDFIGFIVVLVAFLLDVLHMLWISVVFPVPSPLILLFCL